MKISIQFCIISTVVLFLPIQCKHETKQTTNVSELAEDKKLEAVDTLAPLTTEEVYFQGDEPFGEIIELKGRHITGDTAIFRIKGGDARFIPKNNAGVLTWDVFEPLLLFKLPELKSIMFLGNIGNGPGELLYPYLIDTPDTGAICYVTDLIKYGTLFRLTNDYRLEAIDSPLKSISSYHAEHIYHLGGNEYMYVEKRNEGMDIMKSRIENDSILTEKVYHLNLRSTQQNWAAYMGCFGVNAAKNRMVYAYKYYRKLKFMDLDAKQVRTVTFRKEIDFDDNSLNFADGMDRNVTQYYELYVQPDYVYISYSGKTPVEKMKEIMNHKYYLYIEQFDWNGNPIRKFKLDRSGLFSVDEKKQTLYLASSLFDDPFFVYDLPK